MDLKPTYIDPDNPSQLREPRANDTFINEPDVSFDNISDLTDYKIGQSPRTKTANVMGYYSAGDGGGGTFYWDANESQSNHNGGTIIDPNHSATIGSSSWYSSENSGSGCWKRKNVDIVYCKSFGAKGNDSNNDTTAIQKASDTVNNEQVLVARNGVFLIDGITLNCNLHMESGSWFKYNGTQNGNVVEVTSVVDNGNIYIDGNGKDCSGVYFTTNGSSTKFIKVKNVTASSTSSTSIYPVGFNANNISVDKIVLRDNDNTGQSNGSFPQGVSVVGTSDGIYIDKIDQENGASCLVTGSNSGEIKIGDILADSLEDNACYLLGGDVSIDSVYYSGDEEGVVCSGARKVDVGRITTYGDCITALSADDVGDMNIGEIVSIEDNNGDTITTFFNTRSSNTNSGKISIGSLKGTIKSSNILNADDGTVEYFTIENVDVKQNYFSDGNPLSRWFDIRGCKGFSLRNVNIKIVDPSDSLGGPDQFISNVGTPTKDSFIHYFDVQCLQSDEVSSAPYSFRGNFAVENVEVIGARWRTDIGPYAREVSFSERDTANVIPSTTSGYWNKGTVLFDDDLNEGEPSGWICITSGSGGTWKSFGQIYSDKNRTEIFNPSTISDDSFTKITPVADTGVLFLIAGGGSSGSARGVSAVVQFRNYGSLITEVINTGTNTDVSSGVPTGTSGTDGNASVYFDSSNEDIYIENRRGGILDVTITISGTDFN